MLDPEPDPNLSPPDPGHARPPSPWDDADQIAAYLGVSLKTIRNWTSAKFIPFVKKGKVVRYHRPTIDKWLSRGACPGRATIAN